MRNPRVQNSHVIVIGAGMGGLTAALLLAHQGIAVTLLERAAAPGGKLREIAVGTSRIDSGPTVFTMRWVLEEILSLAGENLADRLNLQPVDILARHAWSASERLDLFADIGQSADAISAFAGKTEGEGYRAFCARARAIYETLETPFIRGSRPNPLSLVRRAGLSGFGSLMRISPFATLWSSLSQHMKDPRLRQLFGRYATYCGSSPFAAPATLMLVAHVEQAGVWMAEGGMHAIAVMLAGLAAKNGAALRYGATVARIKVNNGRACGVVLAGGEEIDGDAVLFNGDVSALAAGLLGTDVHHAVRLTKPAHRSLSALTWSMEANTSGFPLLRHNVFFSRDYGREFDDIFKRGRLPGAPTVYVCAQDRGADTGAQPAQSHKERLFCLVNAPANADQREFTEPELAQCQTATFRLLQESGLTLHHDPQTSVRTTPTDFASLFPGTGGALYGRASHGWMASFARPGSASRLPGLYLAGGSAHPGPGVPMAAQSGRLAAAAILSDLASMRRFHPAAMPGGISTP